MIQRPTDNHKKPIRLGDIVIVCPSARKHILASVAGISRTNAHLRTDRYHTRAVPVKSIQVIAHKQPDKTVPAICTGFYQELRDLQESDKNADFGFLENEIVSKNMNAYDFLHGYCDNFAAGLNQTFGYRIQAIYDKKHNLIHAYCVKEHPAYGTCFIDVRGCTNDPRAFFSEFENLSEIPENAGMTVHDWETEPKSTKPDYTKTAQTLIEKYKEYFII